MIIDSSDGVELRTSDLTNEEPRLMNHTRHRSALVLLIALSIVLPQRAGRSSHAARMTLQRPTAAAWTPRASLPTGRVGPAVAVSGGLLYAVGGADGRRQILATVEVYDPATDHWESCGRPS